MQSKQKWIPLVNNIIQTEEDNPAAINGFDAGTSSINPVTFDSSNDTGKSIGKLQIKSMLIDFSRFLVQLQSK